MEPSAERFYDDKTTTFAQATFGWSLEDIGMQIQDMAGGAKETTYSMGDDAPLAVLSVKAHPTYNYFKQRFAQVTNPPIDPLREGVVMSLGMTLGKKERSMLKWRFRERRSDYMMNLFLAKLILCTYLKSLRR